LVSAVYVVKQEKFTRVNFAEVWCVKSVTTQPREFVNPATNGTLQILNPLNNILKSNFM